MFFLTGVARYLFVPLAEAVVFAMLASYLLSRTLVPTLAMYLLRLKSHGADAQPVRASAARLRARLRPRAAAYVSLLAVLLRRRVVFVPAVSAGSAARRSCCFPGSARISFPPRTPGSSCCTCAPRPARASRRPRASATWWSSPSGGGFRQGAGQHAGQHRAALQQHQHHLQQLRAHRAGGRGHFGVAAPNHRPTADYVRALRAVLPREFPGTAFYFLPADMVSQILNFGLPAPIDVQVDGPERGCQPRSGGPHHGPVAARSGHRRSAHPAAVRPAQFARGADRTKAAQSGYTQRDVASSLLISLSGSFQTRPSSC